MKALDITPGELIALLIIFAALIVFGYRMQKAGDASLDRNYDRIKAEVAR